MYDDELIAIAAFNMSAAARRIIALAQSAESTKVRSGLLAVAELLNKEERRLRTYSSDGSGNTRTRAKRAAKP